MKIVIIDEYGALLKPNVPYIPGSILCSWMNDNTVCIQCPADKTTEDCVSKLIELEPSFTGASIMSLKRVGTVKTREKVKG